MSFVIISSLLGTKNFIDYFAKNVVFEPDFTDSVFIWAMGRKAAAFS